VFPHETAEMQANLLLRREDIFSLVPQRLTGIEDDSCTTSVESEQFFFLLYPSPEMAIVILVFGAKPPSVFSSLIFEYRVKS
jgi:hypothetical protein